MKIEKIDHAKDVIEIGKWKFSTDYGVVDSPDNKTLVIEPRLSKLLYLLSLNANVAVSRKYLIENIWTNTIVNKESLNRAIADLRKILLVHFKNSAVIETIPKRGYKLSLKVEPKKYIFKVKINAKKFLLLLVLLSTILILLVHSNILNFKVVA